MTTESCTSNLSDCDLQAPYQTARAKLSPTLDPDERVKIWQEIWALSGELGRRYPLSTETLSA